MEHKIFDTHIHFNDDNLYKEEEIVNLIKEAKEQGVGNWLCASFDIKSSIKAVELANKYNEVYAGIAIHPNDVQNHNLSDISILEELIINKKVIAIGETGLDYYYSIEHKELQKKFLLEHINLAIKYNLILQLHIRDKINTYEAYDDIIEILKKYNLKKVIIHCFSANKDYALKFLDINCYINIGGAVTFKNAKQLQEAVEVIPLNRLLLETDAPYLTPHPFRGKINEPKYIILTAQKISEIKSVPIREIIFNSSNNILKLIK